MVPVTGAALCRLLMQALGLDPSQAVSRIVVVADCTDVARVYVQKLVPPDALLALAEAVKGVGPHEVGFVDYTADHFEVVTVKGE